MGEGSPYLSTETIRYLSHTNVCKSFGIGKDDRVALLRGVETLLPAGVGLGRGGQPAGAGGRRVRSVRFRSNDRPPSFQNSA